VCGIESLFLSVLKSKGGRKGRKLDIFIKAYKNEEILFTPCDSVEWKRCMKREEKWFVRTYKWNLLVRGEREMKEICNALLMIYERDIRHKQLSIITCIKRPIETTEKSR
jgi:hypothetical protein